MKGHMSTSTCDLSKDLFLFTSTTHDNEVAELPRRPQHEGIGWRLEIGWKRGSVTKSFGRLVSFFRYVFLDFNY